MPKLKSKRAKPIVKKQPKVKKKEPKRSKEDDELDSQGKEILALLVLFAGLFIYVTNHFPSTTGLVGFWVVDYFLFNIFGQTIQYLPTFLIGGAFALFITNKAGYKSTLFGIISAFTAFTIYYEFKIIGAPATVQLPISTDGGGLVGVIGAYIFNESLGTNGSLIVLLAIACIAAVLVFNVSVKAILEVIAKINNLIFGLIDDASPAESGEAYPWSYKFKQLGIFLFCKKEKASKYDEAAFNSLRQIKTPSAPPERIREKPELKIIKPPEISVPAKPKLELRSKEGEYKDFELPALDCLESGKYKSHFNKELEKKAREKALILEETLASFNVRAHVVHITPGPAVTRYELQPGEGVKISKITNLSQDIALKMAATSVRIEAPIPGKALIGVEVPNSDIAMVKLRNIIDLTNFESSDSKLLTGLGLKITGEAITMDIGKMPHLLVAGATGSGKSVCVNAIIVSILLRARPDEVKFLMIDPKKVELSLYDGIPHLVAPVVTNPHLAAATLKQWALAEMERRYEDFAEFGVKDIAGYNTKIETIKEEWKLKEAKRFQTWQLKQAEFRQQERLYQDEMTATPQSNMNAQGDVEYPEEEYTPSPEPEKIPYLVVVIDELADLMMVASQDVENTICRLAQMARATGIHLVIATQRPSVNVVTGLIKANVPSRISFAVQSQIDSRTILDSGGAEKLLGKGDMLYMPAGQLHPTRIQGVFVSEKEVKKVVSHLKKQGKPNYDSEILDVKPEEKSKGSTEESKTSDTDDVYEKAKDLVRNTKYASTSYLQRKLRIGYNRAARIMDELEEDGIISAYDGEKKARQVIS